ncbi:hypothetical protein ACVIN2_000454 [Bradyrhizobium sp. USDA 3650]
MSDARRLQRLCERQAVLTSNSKVRAALLEMAEEYRHQADCEDVKEPASEKLDLD